jgi:hypothetical protein
MKSKKLDKVWVGLLIGLLGETIGFIFVFFMYKVANIHLHYTFEHFWNTRFVGNPDAQSAVLSLAMVFNAFIFFYLLNLGHQKAAKGIISLGFLLAPYIVYLKFFS